MVDVLPAPPEVDQDGQVLKHTTAPEHRRRKRRIMRPRETDAEQTETEVETDASEATAEPSVSAPVASASDAAGEVADSADAPSEAAAQAERDRMRLAVQKADARAAAERTPPSVPVVEFLNADGETLPPPLEPNPNKRDEVTSMPGPSRSSKLNKGQPGNLDDIMALFDIGEQYYVRVERLTPKYYVGNACDGLQKPITRYMKETEFARLYGGNKYKFIVYGPRPGGGSRPQHVDFRGNTIPVPLTDPIVCTVTSAPPNMHMRIVDEEDEDDYMSQTPDGYTRERPVRPGQSNNADARMLEAKLAHEREEATRKQAERKERIEEERSRHTREEREHVGVIQSVSQIHQSSLEAQREAFEQGQRIAMATGMQARPGASAEEMRFLHESMQKIQSEHEKVVNQLNASHAAATERLHTAHREELTRLDTQRHDDGVRRDDQHRAEIERLQTQLQNERNRADQSIRDAERALNERQRETEKRADKDIADARREATERVDTIRRESTERMEQMRREYDQRILDNVSRQNDRHEDLKSSNERELRQNDNKWEMKLATERSSFEAQMAVKNHELDMLREENTRLRDENAKPIHERVREFKETASALGMQEPGEGGGAEPDWKSTLMQMALTAVEKAPELMRSAGDAVKQLRQGGTPEQQAAYVQQARQRMVQGAGQHPLAAAPPMQNLPFAVDDADDFRPGTYVPVPQAPAPVQYIAPPLAQQAPAAVAAAAEQQQLQLQQVPNPPVQQIPTAPQPMQSVPPPAAQSAPPRAASIAPEPEEPADDPALDPMILQYREPFEQALGAGATPDEVALTLMSKFGPALVMTALPLISARRIRTALERNGFGSSILCRREGQKFLRAVRGIMEQRARSGAM